MRRSSPASLALCAALALPAWGKKPAAPSPVDPLLEKLALGLPAAEAQAALDELRKRRDPAARVVLARYARHLDPSLRAAAVGALAELPDTGDMVRAALGDPDAGVRAAAAEVVAARRDRTAVPALLMLLRRGDAGVAEPLAALADDGVALQVAELSGRAPDAVVARALGAMLLRRDLGPEAAYVGVVRALGGMPGGEAVAALERYIASAPPGTARASVREARALHEQRVAR